MWDAAAAPGLVLGERVAVVEVLEALERSLRAGGETVALELV